MVSGSSIIVLPLGKTATSFLFFVRLYDLPLFSLLFGLSTIPVENSVENPSRKHQRPHGYANLSQLHNF